MALQHDHEGFLTGPRQEIDHAAYARHLAILQEIRGDGEAIRKDVAAIRKSLVQPARSVTRGPASNSSVFRPTTLAELVKRSAAATRGADGRFTATKPVAPSTAPGARSVSPLIAPSSKAVAAGGSQQRKANGQFGGGSGSGSSDPDEKRKARDDRDSSHALGNAAESLKRTAGEMISGTAQVDPAIAAAKEVGDIVSPALGLLKPLSGLFKRKPKDDQDKAIPWYRRIWSVLRDIKEKSGGKGGGLLGGFNPLSLLSKIPGAGLIGTLLKGAGSLLGRGGKGAAGMLGKGAGFLGKMGGGLLKRIPILGALLSGGSALASIFGADDPNKSAADNRKDRFAGGGAGIGSLIGGGLGMLLGPIGSIAGAAIGDIVGKQVGEWLSTVNWEDVGKTIGDTWTATTNWFKDTWTTVTTFFSDSWKKISDIATGAFTAVSDWVSGKVGAVKKAVGATVDTAKDMATSAVNKGSDLASQGVDALKNAANTATGGAYKGGSNANKAALVEAMNGSGIKDPKEQAMFMAQMDHESGGFRNLSENLNYSKKGLLKTFGKYYKTDDEAAADANNPEAIANKVYGGRMGNTDPGDGYKFRGRGFTQLTGKANYAAAGKDLGLDLINNPELATDPANAAKISAWYWKKNNLGAAGKAGDVEAATQKINGGLNGLADRKDKYSAYLAQANAGGLTMQTGNDTKAVPPVAVTQAIASASGMPKVPAMLAPIAVSAKPVSYAPTAPDLTQFAPKDAPSLVKPIGSSAKGGQTSVRVDNPLSQNLSDRSIAAVATGGIGMTGTL